MAPHPPFLGHRSSIGILSFSVYLILLLYPTQDHVPLTRQGLPEAAHEPINR